MLSYLKCILRFEKEINTSLIVIFFITVVLFISCSNEQQQQEVRKDINLNSGWKTIANDTNSEAYSGFENSVYKDTEWSIVDVPHNWDRYHGYLRKVHSNRHGYAWYRKEFTLEEDNNLSRYFLYFEGVGSYATVWLNGNKAGYHAGGRTTFTIDITDLIHFGKPNILAVRADHPSEIRDLPWVCGGCSTERGFSEGSQPMGIFRPVHLIITNDLRIEPFGIHIWNDTSISEKQAEIFINTEIKNYSDTLKIFELTHTLVNRKGKKVAQSNSSFQLAAGESMLANFRPLKISNPILWSIENPYLYTLNTKVKENGQVIDAVSTQYGIRWISWPTNRKDSTNQFLLNGKPVFINGIGEYEHMFGGSHAFSKEQIKARVEQIKAAGFNAFRDAHQPHNLLYQEYFDNKGMLWWTQMSAHIFYDTPEFKENFKRLLKEWIKERRNNPSNIIWGLQNESTLPTDFAQECVQIIREMDPTASSQRIVTTCNGGTGTDWNVIQNWSGTYGGDPYNYANELSEQLLNGEYGAWRSLDLHTEGPYNQKGILSEDRMTQLLQIKIQQAESVRDKVCGQFLWVLSSHDNPGRIQSGEALRDIDRIGPVNYKGLLTPWGEPIDAYYMYRSHYAPKETSPMVYIVSHTWPNRWNSSGIKDSITVYSNCDEVELFNDIDGSSLGKIKRSEKHEPFIWKKADINYNVLLAKGYVNNKEVANDIVVLNHLPESSGLKILKQNKNSINKPLQNHYLYRVNCGGKDYTDEFGKLWLADRKQSSNETWGSTSWTDKFEGLPDFYGSQRRTFDPISRTNDWDLFQTFRYGREDLTYNFPVPNGRYTIELFLTEPWYGTGGGFNCTDWRLFDIAINKDTVLKNFDIWKTSGHDKAVGRVFPVKVEDGNIKIWIPQVKSGQAIISAIAISTQDTSLKPTLPSSLNITDLKVYDTSNWKIETWLDIGNQQYTDTNIIFRNIPSILYGATWIKTPIITDVAHDSLIAEFMISEKSDVFIALPSEIKAIPIWMTGFIDIGIQIESNRKFKVYSKRLPRNQKIKLYSISQLNTDTANYSVFIVPASNLTAPSDQRPITIYSSKDAELSGSAGKRRLVKERHYIEYTNNNESEIKWTFQVGLASTYGVHFKFQNNTGDAVQAEMIIRSSTGIEMHREMIEMYYKPNNWRTVKINTGTTINAGEYTVSLKINKSKGLLIQHMEIQ